MWLISSILFALSASLDALLVGISYGIRGICIRLWQNLLVSLITLFGTCLSIGFGTLLLPVLPGSVASCIGSAVVILLGLYYMTKTFFVRLQQYYLIKNQVCAELQKNSVEDVVFTPLKTNVNDLPSRSDSPKFIKEILLMGTALSLNNIGIGFGASIAGLSFLSTSIATLFFSVLFLFLGNKLGQSRFLSFADRFSEPLSGALLILLGVCQLFF